MFKALSDGGKVQQPLIETFFAERFGMVADKFGIGWMVVAGPKTAMSGRTAQQDTAQPSPDFVISRVFDAPRDLVWQAFTEPDHMRHWWGPKGFSVIAAKMDLRPGGTFHYGMKAPDGSDMWGKFVFREIVPRERIVFINSFSDEAGGTTRHPMAHVLAAGNAVRSSRSRMRRAARPRFTVRWSPHNATEEERKTFDAGHDSMQQGWSGTLDQLADYLARRR